MLQKSLFFYVALYSLGSYIHVYTYKLTFRVNYVYKHLFYFNSPPNSSTHQLINSVTQ